MTSLAASAPPREGRWVHSRGPSAYAAAGSGEEVQARGRALRRHCVLRLRRPCGADLAAERVSMTTGSGGVGPPGTCSTGVIPVGPS